MLERTAVDMALLTELARALLLDGDRLRLDCDATESEDAESDDTERDELLIELLVGKVGAALLEVATTERELATGVRLAELVVAGAPVELCLGILEGLSAPQPKAAATNHANPVKSKRF